VFLVTFTTNTTTLAHRVNPAEGQFPPAWRLVASHSYGGFGAATAAVYADVSPPPR
jgi:hypothetical protein